VHTDKYKHTQDAEYRKIQTAKKAVTNGEKHAIFAPVDVLQ